MKHNKNTKKMIAVMISATMIALLILSSSITAFAYENAQTTIETVNYDLTEATSFVFSESGIEVSEGLYNGYKVDGTSLTIKSSGTYVVSGNCSNGTIVIKKNVTDVTLILNGLTLSSSATAPITCNKGSEVTIVALEGTVNNLSDDEYNNDDIYTDENLYPDIENAVIKCKDGSNVTICGSGTINVYSYGKNGIKGGYDLYEEDDNGNTTDVLLSTASLTIKEVTLNIVTNVNDGLKSDKELNILSGNITISAVDDGIKCDYIMNIGSEDEEGPTITIKKSTEGIEAATLNIYSGNIYVNATDDGINAANSDLTNYSFSYNQYGGYVYVNVTNGDGIDSNGTINLSGGSLEVYSPAQGDGDPLDSERGTYFNGATVLAVGHLGMAQGYSSTTPYVVFGSTTGNMFGGFRGMENNQTNLVTAGNTIQITDESGNVLYSSKAIRNASYVLFSSKDLVAGSTYTLKNGTTIASSASATTTSNNQGQFPGGNQGMRPNENGQGQFPGGNQGTFPNENGQGQFPGGNQGTLPNENGQGQFPGGNQGTLPNENGQGQFPGGNQGMRPNENGQDQFPGGNQGTFPNENGQGQFPGGNQGTLPNENGQGQFPGGNQGTLPNENCQGQFPGNQSELSNGEINKPFEPNEEFNPNDNNSDLPVEEENITNKTLQWLLDWLDKMRELVLSLFAKLQNK